MHPWILCDTSLDTCVFVFKADWRGVVVTAVFVRDGLYHSCLFVLSVSVLLLALCLFPFVLPLDAAVIAVTLAARTAMSRPYSHDCRGVRAANGDQYEGHWFDDKKQGPGRFFYMSTRKMYEGEWLDDVAKCGVFSSIPTEFLGVGLALARASEDHFKLPEVRWPLHGQQCRHRVVCVCVRAFVRVCDLTVVG